MIPNQVTGFVSIAGFGSDGLPYITANWNSNPSSDNILYYLIHYGWDQDFQGSFAQTLSPYRMASNQNNLNIFFAGVEDQDGLTILKVAQGKVKVGIQAVNINGEKSNMVYSDCSFVQDSGKGFDWWQLDVNFILS